MDWNGCVVVTKKYKIKNKDTLYVFVSNTAFYDYHYCYFYIFILMKMIDCLMNKKQHVCVSCRLGG